jgi:hypothetical protein
VYWKKSNVDVGGPWPRSLFPFPPRLSVKNDPVTGVLPTARFELTGEFSLERPTYGVEWFPRRISSERELDVGVAGAFETARVRGSTKIAVCGGSGSSPWSDSSSDEESRSSMAFGWF